MSKIVLTTTGSTGDINPFIALGLELQRRGHEVLFAVEPLLEPAITGAGFRNHRIPGLSEATPNLYAREMFESSNPLASLKLILNHYMLPYIRDKVDELRAACVGADMLVTSQAQYAAGIVGESSNISWVSLYLSPLSVPSRELAPLATPPQWLPKSVRYSLNRAGWNLVSNALAKTVDAPINAMRAEYDLPAHQQMLFLGNASPLLVAVLTSPTLQPRPSDWPAHIQMTGFCFWDGADAWQAPADLTAFLNGPQPIIAVSTGSMAMHVTGAFDQFFRTSVAAIKRIGGRALVIGAPPAIIPMLQDEQVYTIDFAPFSQIYPRCAAAIHHGGIGTVAQVLRAGIPTLIAPWGADQEGNGRLLTRLGVGRMLSRKRYSEAYVVAALRAILQQPSYHAHATAIAQRIAAEDGVATLADAIIAALPVPAPAPQ